MPADRFDRRRRKPAICTAGPRVSGLIDLTDDNRGALYNPTVSQHKQGQEDVMPNSVYKVIEVIGSSPTSWEEASQNAIKVAGESLHNLRIAEVIKLDLKIEDGKIQAYRARLNLSFKIDQ
jgi:hypothetical protein